MRRFNEAFHGARSLEEMQMNKLLVVTTCVLLTAPALAQSAGEKTGVNSMLGVSPKTADFVSEAATGGLFEIKSGQLAEAQGDAATKSFARRMIADHQKADAELKDLVQKQKIDVAIPTDLTSSQQSKLDKLTQLKSADFDKQYRDDQYSAHKDTVSLFQRYAKGGDDAALKQWAQRTLPTLEHHLHMARQLDKQASK
jgi:putative membrane protein